jgi:hypothetical protein
LPKTRLFRNDVLKPCTISKVICRENDVRCNVTKPMDIFAERRLQRRSHTEVEDMLVRFGPVIRQDGAAFCRYTLSGRDGAITRDIWGVDDVQAVQLAMSMAGSDLDRLADGGKYSVVGDSDGEVGHGLPTAI